VLPDFSLIFSLATLSYSAIITHPAGQVPALDTQANKGYAAALAAKEGKKNMGVYVKITAVR
jgi:hypothetical protein